MPSCRRAKKELLEDHLKKFGKKTSERLASLVEKRI